MHLIKWDECIAFDHWKQINDQLRLLRFELSCIPIDNPRRVEISKLIEKLKLTKKKYNDTLQILSYPLVTKSATAILHSPPLPSETMQHCNSLDSTSHQPLCSNYDENTILTDLMNIDNQTILCLLDKYVKELSTSQDAKVDLKLLIVSVIPIYSFSETINLFYYYFFILNDKLITFSVNFFF